MSFFAWVRAKHKRASVFLATIVVLCLVLFALNPIVVTYERSALALFPSAERAFSYGSRHLDYAHPSLYSIDDAAYFYQKAAALDAEATTLLRHMITSVFLKCTRRTGQR